MGKTNKLFTMIKRSSLFSLLMLTITMFSCENRNEILPIEKTATVNFSHPSGSVFENNPNGIDIKLHLSIKASENGSITIRLVEGTPGQRFITQPGMDENLKLTLPVIKGSTEVSFKVISVDDQLYNGHLNIRFEIITVNGDLVKGSNNFYDLTIQDNELNGLLKAFETSGNGSHRKDFEYSHLGKIKRVLWQFNQNQTTLGQYIYLYNDAGKIIRINGDPGSLQQIFYYEDGKLKRNEKSNYNDPLVFDEYSISDDNMLQGVQTYWRMADGSTHLKESTEFTYFSSGSVHTITTYRFEAPVTNVVTKKITFQDYVQRQNPLPDYQDIPGLMIQPYLPQKMIIEEHGTTFSYQFEYKFSENEKLTERKTTGPSGIETTKYSYY